MLQLLAASPSWNCGCFAGTLAVVSETNANDSHPWGVGGGSHENLEIIERAERAEAPRQHSVLGHSAGEWAWGSSAAFSSTLKLSASLSLTFLPFP